VNLFAVTKGELIQFKNIVYVYRTTLYKLSS